MFEVESAVRIPRTSQQISVLRGDPSVTKFTSWTFGLSSIVVWYFVGPQGIILYWCAIAPSAFAIWLFSRGKKFNISLELILEMFWFGGILSIAIASILELMGQVRTSSAWQCEKSQGGLACNMVFIPVVIVTVGFAEEFAKLFPLSRISSKLGKLPFTAIWWGRLVDTPIGFAIAGCASGAGFACVENVKYAFSVTQMSNSLVIGLETCLFRAILAIPFHISCAGLSSMAIARKMFFPKSSETLLSGREASASIGTIAWALVLPSVLHGVYDSSLFIAEQMLSHIKNGNTVRISVGVGAILVAMGTYLAALASFVVVWRRLAVAEKAALPELMSQRVLMEQQLAMDASQVI